MNPMRVLLAAPGGVTENSRRAHSIDVPWKNLSKMCGLRQECKKNFS
jgi:hypothetical protein